MNTISDAYQRHYPTSDPNYIPGLDGVRAASVSLVILAHAGFGNVVPGGLGVTIFFFISGLLITNLLCSEYIRRGRIDIKSFYVRRYLRLSPEMYFYVFVCTALSLIFLGDISMVNIAGGLFYFTNYIKIFHYSPFDTPFTIGHLWSLAVEEHFYLTYPLLLVSTIAFPRRLVAILIGICIFSLVVRTLAVFLGFPVDYPYYASEARLDSIAYGCLCALSTRYFNEASAVIAKYHWLALAAAAGLMVISLIIRDPLFRDSIRFSMQGMSLFLGITVLYGAPIGTSTIWLLERAIPRFVGRMSYGMYLWHFMPIQLYAWLRGYMSADVMPVPEKGIAAFIGFAFAIAAAYPSYRFILGSVARLRRRFGSHQTGWSTGTDQSAAVAVPHSSSA